MASSSRMSGSSSTIRARGGISYRTASRFQRRRRPGSRPAPRAAARRSPRRLRTRPSARRGRAVARPATSVNAPRPIIADRIAELRFDIPCSRPPTTAYAARPAATAASQPRAFRTTMVRGGEPACRARFQRACSAKTAPRPTARAVRKIQRGCTEPPPGRLRQNQLRSAWRPIALMRGRERARRCFRGRCRPRRGGR
jgi:hypothetical protein